MNLLKSNSLKDGGRYQTMALPASQDVARAIRDRTGYPHHSKNYSDGRAEVEDATILSLG